MAATGQDFTLYAGDDKRPEIHVTDLEGNPVNLEGASIEWKAVQQSDGTEVISKTTGGGCISVKDAKNAKFIIKINSIDTEGEETKTLDHEAVVTSDSGMTTHVTTGTIDLIASNI